MFQHLFIPALFAGFLVGIGLFTFTTISPLCLFLLLPCFFAPKRRRVYLLFVLGLTIAFFRIEHFQGAVKGWQQFTGQEVITGIVKQKEEIASLKQRIVLQTDSRGKILVYFSRYEITDFGNQGKKIASPTYQNQ